MPTSLDDIRQFAVDNNYRVTLKLIPLSQAPRYERERFEDLPTFPLSSNNLLDEINIETGGTAEHREWGTIRYDNGTFWCGDSIL